MKKTNNDTSFIVNIKSTDNASWQGTLTWVNENKTVPFRSALELIKLMDSATEGNSSASNR